jgi:hypothetical protein
MGVGFGGRILALGALAVILISAFAAVSLASNIEPKSSTASTTVKPSGPYDYSWFLGGTFFMPYSTAADIYVNVPPPYIMYCFTNNTMIEFIGELQNLNGVNNGNYAVIVLKLIDGMWRLEFWSIRSDGTAYVRLPAVYLTSSKNNVFFYIGLLSNGHLLYYYYDDDNYAIWVDDSRNYGSWMNSYYLGIASTCNDFGYLPTGWTTTFHNAKIYSDEEWQTPTVCPFHDFIVTYHWDSNNCRPGTSQLSLGS